MAITSWVPLRTLAGIEREVQDLLERFSTQDWFGEFGWSPSTDVLRDDRDLVVRTELPGVDPAEDLTVQVAGGVLTIAGEKRVETEVDEGDRFLQERRFGSFERMVLLPDGARTEETTATFDHGILTVRVPVEEVEPDSDDLVIEVPITSGA